LFTSSSFSITSIGLVGVSTGANSTGGGATGPLLVVLVGVEGLEMTRDLAGVDGEPGT